MPKADLKAKRGDELVAYVVKSPIRIDALAILNERTSSISEIAEIMGISKNTLSHHINDLHDAGCIEIVRREQRRGTHENFYIATLRPNISDAAWAKLSLEERLELSRLVFGAIVAEALGAIRAGTFDSRQDRHLSWRILKLDEEGWTELVEEKNESLSKVEAIQARSFQRMVKSGEQSVTAIAAALAFERAEPGRSPGHVATV